MGQRTARSTLRALAVRRAFAGRASWRSAQAARQFSFAYDQPPTTAYGIAANIFDAKLKELSAAR